MFTGKSAAVGMPGPTVAWELTDGQWTWHGFTFATLEDAKAAARKAGY